jgi:alpha-galactosidase/6-phospho-beta-glucosidase family protein
VLQVSCSISSQGVLRPTINDLPAFINNTLASRILQEHMKGTALAKQDEKMMKQAVLVVPEGVDISKLRS